MAEATGVGHVRESSSPAVLEKPILAHAGDQNIGETVVVVVAHGDAHSVHLYIQASLVGYVGKRAIAIVAIEAERRRLPFMAGPVRAVNQENILPAIAVVVEKGAA